MLNHAVQIGDSAPSTNKTKVVYGGVLRIRGFYQHFFEVNVE